MQRRRGTLTLGESKIGLTMEDTDDRSADTFSWALVRMGREY